MTRCAQPPRLPSSSGLPRLVLQPPTSTSYLIAFQTIPSHGVLFCIVLIVAFQLFHHCHFGISVTPELTKRSLKKKKHTAIRDFPGGPVVRNLPCNAGNVGSIPGWGTKIPRVVGATEPMCLNYRTRNKTTTKDPTCHDQDSMQSDKQIKITPEKAIAIGQVCVLISFVVGFYCCVIRRHTGKYLVAFRRLGTSVQLL